jgi:hypothetical protein
MSPRQRAETAELLVGCESPILQALGHEMGAYSAREDASIAEFNQEIRAAHRAEMERIEASLPSLPAWSEISSRSADGTSDGDPA